MSRFFLAIVVALLVCRVSAASLLVASNGSTSHSILRYDNSTGQFQSVLASGNGLSGPVGLAIGPDGNLYVTNQGTDSVLRFNAATGEFLGVFASGGGLVDGEDLLFGPNGNLFVASFDNTVKQFDGVTGQYLGDFASAPNLINPQGLAFGTDGDLFVSTGGATSDILRFNGTTGALKGVFVPGAVNAGTTTADILFGPDGNLYVAGYNANNVRRYDGTTGALIDVFASGNGLTTPWGLAFGDDGNLYVGSSTNNAIKRFNGTTGEFIDTFASDGGLSAPRGLIFGPDQAAAVPEPASVALWGGITVFGLAGGWRRKRLNAA